MTKVAIYARYSSDLQSPYSIDDQVRLLREFAAKRDWTVTHVFSDAEIGGALLLRPGVQKLLAGIRERQFDVVLAESIDRLSRSQEGAPHIFIRATHNDIRLVTLEEGEVNEMHIGLKGTMGAMQLKQIAAKTHRGQRGVVERGKSAGGNSYGYDVVHEFAPNGRPNRGGRTINETEAAVVLRIFSEYVAGRSPKSIAIQLNREGIAGPRGNTWGPSSIYGNRQRGIGILNNELYVGRIVWNRQQFRKDPDTGKRQARLNPESEWITTEVPELRIVPQELWDKVKESQSALDIIGTQFWKKQRPKSLLSHMTKCGCCGGGFSKISAHHLGCSTARNKGTCDNLLTMRADTLEESVIDALRKRLMDEKLCEEFCREYTAHMNRLRMQHNAARSSHQSELERNHREMEKLIDAITQGVPVSQVKDRMQVLADRKVELESLLAEAPDAAPLVHPIMARRYHEEVRNLLTSLNQPEHRAESATILRSLIDSVVLTPNSDHTELRIDLLGQLAGILQIASGGELKLIVRQNQKTGGAPLSRDPTKNAKMVAGAGFEPATFRL